MNQFKDLLNDNIIDKSELVNKRHEYLGLDATQAAFLAKIFINNKDCYENTNLNEVAELMGVNIDTARSIIEPLIINGFLTLIVEGEEHKVNFNTFIEKLLSSYSTPLNDSTIDHKLKWIDSKIDFIINDDNRNELKTIIEKNDWEIISNVIDKLSEQTEQNFPLLISFINSALNTKQVKDERIKSLMEVNWLK